MLLPLCAPCLVEHHQLIRTRHRQLAQQNLVDERENRRIGANSEREGQDRDDREERAAAETAQSESKVGHGFEKRECSS